MNKQLTTFLLICIFNYAFAQQTHPINGVATPTNDLMAFTNATIVINHQTTIKNATLVVKGNRIVEVGSNIKIPVEANVVNLNGFYIYPAFIDLYSNYGVKELQAKKQRNQAQQFLSNKPGAYNWNEAVKAELNAVDFFEPESEKLNTYQQAGFGIVATSIHDGIVRGTAALVATANLPAHQTIINPTIAGSFSFNKGSSTQDYPGSAMGAVALIRQTYYDANWYKNQQNEKNITLEAFNKLRNLPAIFEAENKLAVLRAVRIANEFKANYIIKGNGDEYQRANEIKLAGAKLIVPVNFPSPYEVEDPFDAENVSTTDLKHWELAPANLAILNQKQIPFCITMHGCKNSNEFFKNLRTAIQHGLPKTEALKALTTNPAIFLNAQQQIGTLTKGAFANFFICDTDVFEPNATIYEFYSMGAKHSLAQIKGKTANGKYKVNNNEILSITEKGNQLKAEWFGSDTPKVNITLSNNLYQITLQHKTQNITRIVCWISNTHKQGFPENATQLEGTQISENGLSQKFSAVWFEPNIEKKKDDNTEKPVLGDILYPFTDYGNKKLPEKRNYIIKNATVWTNEKDGILKQTDVAVSNGKILSVGKNLALKDAEIIDATGKHLTSGIIDEHSHIAIYRGVNECTQSVTAEVRIGDVINCDDINIYRQLAGGVVAVQQLHGSCNAIGGQSALIKLRWGFEPEEMKIKNADGFIKFALGENVKQSNWGITTNRYPQTRMGVEQIIIDAFYRARAYEQKLKQNPNLTRKDLELDALVEILNKKRFISCHSYVQSEINMLMHLADSFGFKVNTFTHILEGYKVADKMKKHGANASTFADWWAYKYEVVEAIPQNGAILHKVGVNTAINSDDGEMGRRLNQEAAKMIKYGNISEEDAWKMVTLNPAKMLHLDNITGSIKPGKDADLVIWSHNPLSLYAKAELTMVDGMMLFSIEQDKQKRIEIRNERERIIKKMIEAKRKGEKTEVKVSEPDPDYHCEDEGW
ncbi:MAG: amidohydrolase family protein [Bacteroidia bacterium]